LAALENETQAKGLSGFALLDLEARTAALEELLAASPDPAYSERYHGLRERFTALRTRNGKQRAAKPQSQEAWERWRRQQEEANRNWKDFPKDNVGWLSERIVRRRPWKRMRSERRVEKFCNVRTQRPLRRG
jgi:hypothetical protein